MKKLKSPYVVQLLDVLETNNNYYIVQDFCEGGDLGKELKKKKLFSEPDALKILKDILSGFMELLQHGIIHRDLKPENILLRKGLYKLADFGFAKTVQNFNDEMMKSLVGTPLYMSPQILKHDEYTTKSDIWSIGLIYYELLFGRTPWLATNQYQLVQNIYNQKIDFPGDVAVISHYSKQFILNCLCIEEQERISWDDIYVHPLFAGHFEKSMKQTINLVDREKFIANALRQKLISQKTDLDIIFQNNGYKFYHRLTIKDIDGIFLQILQKPLLAEDLHFLMHKLSGNQQEVTFEVLYNWLQENNCSLNKGNIHLYSTSSENQAQVEQKAKETIEKLIYAIQKFNVEIKKLYKKFDKSSQEQMDIQNFGSMVKRIDNGLVEDEIQAAFNKFDSLKRGYITFQQFNDTLQAYSVHMQQKNMGPLSQQSNTHNFSKSGEIHYSGK